MMSALQAYKEYLALKNHFTKPGYDYIKYNGKVNVNPKTFETRKDKFFFEKLAKHDDVKNFLIANFIINEKAWIKELAYSEEAETNYKNWLKRTQSISYNFKNELSNICFAFDANFKVDNNQHPILLKKYLGKEICLETLCLLLDLTGAKKHWDKQMQYDPIWDQVKTKVEKYTPFIVADKAKIKKIVLDFFS